MIPEGSVVIVGGGISGLATAYWLTQRGIRPVVLEALRFPGGTMRSRREGEWLIEHGPNSALETTPLLGAMLEGLGIADQRIYASPASDKRYILRNGDLHALPMKPLAFLGSGLWSARGKLRLLQEPFIGRGRKEESVAEFVERRLGREFLDYAINPFVAGVFAGDPATLSVRYAFPKLFALEEEYGGLVKGMIGGARKRRARKETAKDRARMFSFREGMLTFPASIGKILGGDFHAGCTVRSIHRQRNNGRSRTFTVTYEAGGTRKTLEAAAVVLSVPAYAASALVEPFSREAAQRLKNVYYPPVTEVLLGFRKEQFARDLDGFGYLIPEQERRNILGTIWSSSIFPGRAPDGHVALTTFVGGSRQPEMTAKNDDELTECVLRDIHSIMGGNGRPVFTSIVRWDRAIPQYTIGYGSVLQAIDRLEAEEPGLFLCGNYRGGIAVGDCVISGEKTAARVAGHVGGSVHSQVTSQSIGA